MLPDLFSQSEFIMPASDLHYVPSHSIIVPEDRQRKDATRDIETLAASIDRIGLLNPLIIDTENKLIAGERRLNACRLLGMQMLPVRYYHELTEEGRILIELEENIKRHDLTWQEEVMAFAKFHEISQSATVQETAEAMGMSTTPVHRRLTIWENREDPRVWNAATLTSAWSACERLRNRENMAELEQLIAVEDNTAEVKISKTQAPASVLAEPTYTSEIRYPKPQVKAPSKKFNIEQTDAIDWMNTWDGAPFTFIHCDFPYGINLDKSGQVMERGVAFTPYADGPEIYEMLCVTLCEQADKLLAPNAHIMHWLSLKTWNWTRMLYEDNGFTVWPNPLIWHKSDNAGVIADAKRGPRHTYEAAMIIVNGDPVIAAPVADSFAAPTGRSERNHPSMKPAPVLRHFFRMFVDEHTRMLDPTCGSGNSVMVADELHAASATGLELSEEYAQLATETCNNAWALRLAGG